MYVLLGHYSKPRATMIRRRSTPAAFRQRHRTDGAEAVGTGEVQLDRPRSEQRTNRREGRKSDRRHCLLRAVRTRRHGRSRWSMDRDDVDQLKKVTISGLTPAGTTSSRSADVSKKAGLRPALRVYT